MNILIVYELFNREYENAQLLACEMQSRGHNTNIVNKATCFKFVSNIDVLIIPNCYTSHNYQLYKYMTNAKNAIIYNLQYEQVLSKAWEDIGYHNPKGEAKNAITLCWGENTFQRLLSNGVLEEKLRLTGALHLDFLSEHFSGFYLQRKEIAQSYNLDTNKKWLLYISSFTVAADNDIVANGLLNSFEDDKEIIQDFIDISKRSREITLNWIKDLIKDDENICFLYRLHPNEIKDSTLMMLEEEYTGRFICIQNYSVKQWINISDSIFTWFSTSIIESFYANINCYILRPIKIPKSMDSVIFADAKVVTDFKTFKETVNHDNNSFSQELFPIDKSLISSYYCNDNNKLAYYKIADVIEELSTNTSDNITFRYYIDRMKFIISHNEPYKSIAENMYSSFYSVFHIKLSKYSPWKKRYLNVLEDRIDNWKKTKQEIIRKNNVLKEIIETTNF